MAVIPNHGIQIYSVPSFKRRVGTSHSYRGPQLGTTFNPSTFLFRP